MGDASGRRAVLLVEDTPADARWLQGVLEEVEGGPFAVVQAETLADAVAAAAHGAIDVALLDLSLPDAQGLSALRAFRNEAPSVPVVVLTGVDDLELAGRAVAEGAQDYLVKGQLHPGVLVRSLRHAIERHALTHALLTSEEILRGVFDGALDGIMLAAVDDGQLFAWNGSFCRMIGREAHEMQALSLQSLFPEADRTGVADRLLGRGEARQEPTGDVAMVRRDGTPFYAEVRASVVRLSTKEYILGVFRDATDRRQAAEALRQSESRYRRVTEQARDVVWHVDLGGRVQFVNQAVEAVLGVSRDEAIGAPSSAFMTAESTRLAERWVAAALAGEPPADHICGELEWVRADSTRVPVEINAKVVRDERGKPLSIEGIARDITMRRQLLAVQRMEAIGRLAGGIAHDFSNFLAVINAYTGFLLDACGHDDSLRADIHVIREAAERAERLTRQLLAFSRRQVQQLEVLSVNTVVTELSKMLSRLIGEDVAYSAALAEDLWPVRADRSQLEQIVMNLAVNARDAVPHGGSVTVETRNLSVRAPEPLGATAVAPGEYVTVKVTDTGTGMDEEAQARAFEPFFTTKEHGRGTGLGLSTVYGIVKQSNGYIRIDSKQGQGTTVTVYLPKTEEQAATTAAPRAIPQASAAGATILIVEDERLVCRAARRILTAAGYEVLETFHPHEALSICESHEGTIHLLLSDVVMPEMDGFKLAERAAEIRPSIRVLHMSGYADDTLERLGGSPRGRPLLPKPFTSESMLSHVGRVLGVPCAAGDC